jgi:hypothetical protein
MFTLGRTKGEERRGRGRDKVGMINYHYTPGEKG